MVMGYSNSPVANCMSACKAHTYVHANNLALMSQHKLYNWCYLYAYRDYLIPNPNTVAYIRAMAAILVVTIVCIGAYE